MVLATRLWAVEKPDLTAVRPAWQRHGLCVGREDVSWFVEKGEPTGPAKAICRQCPVIDECLQYALEQGPSLQGVWGATSQRERKHRGKVMSQSATG